MLVYDTNLELQAKASDNKYAQQVNKAQSFNAIKHKAFDIFYWVQIHKGTKSDIIS